MTTHAQTTISRLKGCILGGAIGDAIGLFTEFLPKPQCQELYGRNPRFSLAPSTDGIDTGMKFCHMDRHRAMFDPAGWTDDTDQTLLILLSFLHANGERLDATDFAARLKFWLQNGLRALDRLPLGVGRTIGSVVGTAGYLDDPQARAREAWERTGKHVAANGAVMRAPIIGALVWQDKDGVSGMQRTFEAAWEIAATSHADPRCLVSCTIASGALAAIMRDALHTEEDLRGLVNDAVDYVQSRDPPLEEGHLAELHTMLWANSLTDLQLDERTSIGYTYKCLASGIWALRQALAAPSAADPEEGAALFERLITELTMEGGDADTNGAVAGALLGAYLGEAAIPRHWVGALAHKDWLLGKSDAATFLLLGESSGLPPYDGARDEDALVDAGKGAYSKEELDARWKILIEALHTRLGDIPGPMSAHKAKEGGTCIIG